jgi:hypothetical protein
LESPRLPPKNRCKAAIKQIVAVRPVPKEENGGGSKRDGATGLALKQCKLPVVEDASFGGLGRRVEAEAVALDAML